MLHVLCIRACSVHIHIHHVYNLLNPIVTFALCTLALSHRNSLSRCWQCFTCCLRLEWLDVYSKDCALWKIVWTLCKNTNISDIKVHHIDVFLKKVLIKESLIFFFPVPPSLSHLFLLAADVKVFLKSLKSNSLLQLRLFFSTFKSKYVWNVACIDKLTDLSHMKVLDMFL